MTDARIDEALARLGPARFRLDEALLERIVRSIEGTVTPVRPLPPVGVLAGALLAACVLVAVAGAAWAGLGGIAVLASWQRASMSLVLTLFAGVLARECAVRWVPGRRPWLSAVSLIWGCYAALMLLYALVFRDYRTEHFVTAGLGCLEQGGLHAIPVAILGLLVLRRGFATRPAVAGAVGGALAGIAGVVFLELHCGNVEVPHRLVWHAAVVPISALFGALIAIFRPRGS